jgi:crotonobetainyl-CoA:carnitine CoA-transferase CaiB-like acyl-CoA transferase
MSLTGDPDGPAYRSGISVFDVMAGLHAAIGILAALNHRNHTGEGQHVEVSLFDTALSAMVNQTTAYVCIGYLGHPFVKETPWAFTAHLFLVDRWDSAIEIAGEFFSWTRKKQGEWAADHQRWHAKAAGEVFGRPLHT